MLPASFCRGKLSYQTLPKFEPMANQTKKISRPIIAPAIEEAMRAVRLDFRVLEMGDRTEAAVRVLSVSYTHLDVYKRQFLSCCRQSAIGWANKLVRLNNIFAAHIWTQNLGDCN